MTGPRVRALAAAAVALALSTSLAACGGQTSAAPPHFRDGGSQLTTRLSRAIERIPFTDEAGRTVRLSDYAGKTIVLGDILTLCQEHCPIDTATFVQLAQQYARTAQDPQDTVFLSITVDPGRDTVPQLAAYRRLYVGSAAHLPQWHLLTASPGDLRKLWSFLHVYVQRVAQDDTVRNWRTHQLLTYDVDHGDDVFFIDPTGRERWLFPDQPYLHGAHIPARMRRFMSTEGVANEDKGTWTVDEGLKVLAWVRAQH